MIKAMAVGRVAAPAVWLRVRKAMSDVASHAKAVRMAVAPHSPRPQRNTRRWPSRSPSRPKVGNSTELISSGRVITQASVDAVLSRSEAMSGRAATRITAGQAATKTPIRVARSVRCCFPRSIERD